MEVDVGTALPALNPTVTGTVTSYTLAPTLPRGLTLNATSGTITGTPFESIDATTYKVTATNSGGSTTFDLSLRVRTSFGAPVPIGYQPFFINDAAYPFNGQPVSLFAWEGRNVAVLSRRSDLNRGTMQLLVAAIDRGYDFYALATGREPSPSPHASYNGKITIADVQKTCGAGCGYLGATGIEADSIYFDQIYNAALTQGLYGSFLFYELGRNFWFYDNKIAYKDPILPWPVVTGYAVVNWWWSMEVAGVKMPVDQCSQLDNDRYYAHMAGVFDTYLSNASLNWNNTLAENKGVAASGCAVDANVLFASFLMRVRKDYGSADFPQKVWIEVGLRPNATTTQAAIDNLVLAASIAANKNLTRVFEQTWRWPVSDAAELEAEQKLGAPL